MGADCEQNWLGGRDSNPDSQIQSLESYHWTTSQQRDLNLRITPTLVNNTIDGTNLAKSKTNA